ncbi:type II restriction endonuclease [Akkermansia muciniphila]|nr:class I SAM-dependent DNA methyltransferase [Akkermansia muciniphila]QHV20831.1 type II restriction endonuclease [Akkermansia muciniphila]QHV23077.1 type II restriction endonuclease [Akkermansia muciniphila]QHV25320.1 type II restriction endonuclease [Akkermansia muciniphila]QHV27563.1 type II restriction endonuclease [Akkermansia muciniphila]
MSDFVQQQGVECDFTGSDSWVILSPIEQSIKRKIEAVGVPLKDWDIQINYGIKTGYNDAFIISTEKRNEILANCKDADERKRTEELIRPILRGRDIKRYGYEWANLWIINTHNGIKGKLPRIDVNEYPAIKAHLDQFWDKISKRADKGDTPYNLRNCAYMEDFNKPKIVWGNLNLKGAYSYAPEGMFINAPSPFLATSNIAVLHILNSKIADYYIRSLGVTRNGGYFEYKPMFVERLPIPQIGLENLNSYPIKPSKEQEKEIEENVYQIYGLSLQEIDYMENRED